MVYQWLTLAGVLVCVPLAVLAWRTRPNPGATPLFVATVGIGSWNGTMFLATVVDSVALSRVLVQLHFAGLVVVVPSMFVLVLEYAGRDDLLHPWTLALLGVEPVLANVLVWTNDAHGLFLDHVPVNRADPAIVDVDEALTGIASVDPGPLFWVHALFHWGLGIVTLLLVGWLAVRRRDIYREQLVLLGVAIVLPLTASLLDNLQLSPTELTEGAFVVTGILLTVAVVRFDLVDLRPIARATVLSNLSSGLVVLDDENRVVDVNPSARELLGLPDDGVIGNHAREVLSLPPEVYDRYESMTDGSETITVDGDDGPCHYRVTITPVTDRNDRGVGRAVLVDDITEQVERQRELERANEQLDQFASVVTHDLRNPLNVARMNVELALDTEDDEDLLREVEASHERMQKLVEDVLTLARQGRTIDDTEPVDAADVADQAWNTVETGRADLDNRLTGVVEADPARLQQVFENLFRNAVEHGSTGSQNAMRSGDAVEHGSTNTQQAGDTVEHDGPVTTTGDGTADDDGPGLTVRVGTIDGDTDTDANHDGSGRGLYVADDGTGIPPDMRETLFEPGESSGAGGTGLGLSIVESIVEAHGWSVTVTESETGGARFEITGLSFQSA